MEEQDFKEPVLAEFADFIENDPEAGATTPELVSARLRHIAEHLEKAAALLDTREGASKEERIEADRQLWSATGEIDQLSQMLGEFELRQLIVRDPQAAIQLLGALAAAEAAPN